MLGVFNERDTGCVIQPVTWAEEDGCEGLVTRKLYKNT